MSFLFARSKPKTPQEVVYTLNELVSRSDLKSDPKVLEEVHRLLSQASTIAHGGLDTPADPDQMSALSKEIYATNVLVPLTHNLALISFEGRRDVTILYTFLLQRQIGNHSPTCEYILRYPILVDILFAAAGQPDIHRNANAILCEFARQEPLLAYILDSKRFWDLFAHCLDQPFEIASDCFTTLSRFLNPQQKLVVRFLQKNGNEFKNYINSMIVCQNYVISRQAIRFQAAMISHRTNKDYISLYVNDFENLKLVMRLMHDKSKTIRYEAFHLFKVFVANPQKPQVIHATLVRNKSEILSCLDELKAFEHKGNEQFSQERAYIYQRVSDAH